MRGGNLTESHFLSNFFAFARGDGFFEISLCFTGSRACFERVVRGDNLTKSTFLSSFFTVALSDKFREISLFFANSSVCFERVMRVETDFDDVLAISHFFNNILK